MALLIKGQYRDGIPTPSSLRDRLQGSLYLKQVVITVCEAYADADADADEAQHPQEFQCHQHVRAMLA